MNYPSAIEPAYLPNQRLPLQLDWILTLKCNYDCSYCTIGERGHNNALPHPPKSRCIDMLKHLYHYSDVVNKYKKEKSKLVILNILGGEAVFHPEIEDILKQSTELYQPYKDRWQLKKRLTTNGTMKSSSWRNICEHLGGCTVSYHSEGPEKLKQQVKENILYLKDIKFEYDVQILLHSDMKYWPDVINFYEWCRENNINYKLKILDGSTSVYNKQQLEFINKKIPNSIREGERSGSFGRACCGGRELCFDRKLAQRHRFASQPNSDFRSWYCSVNLFFLYANGVTGKFYSNKDCKVRNDETLGALADIDTMTDYITEFDEKLANGFRGVRCVQKACGCGICAPKSKSNQDISDILKNYLDC